jgi:SAM-dependent methyltransferase
MTRMTFNRIAYEQMQVCNPTSLSRLDQALAGADLKPGMRALDIGCGNAAVAIHLADRWGLAVTAVERDPLMADLAQARIGQGGVQLVVGDAGAVLDAAEPLDLIVVMGATDAAASGERDPTSVFRRLRDCLRPGGYLLWGEPFWAEEPSPQFRLIIELTNHYETVEGWEAAARAAGLDVTARIDSDATVRAWVAVNPDRPECKGLIARADGLAALFEEEGHRVLGFALWLFQRPA